MAENKWEITKIPSEPPKEMKDSGVQIIGGRIYDSENGKFCHQCRQKRDFVVSCKKLKKHKPCTITFCHKCLLNRYGEKAVEVVKLEDWICPKCRGVCNCSCCMKKKGFQPTGKLVPTAKAAEVGSVVDFIHHKGSEGLEPADRTALLKSSLPNKGLATPKRCLDEGNSCVELNKKRKPSNRALSALYREKIVVPLGSILTIVAGIELPVEDIGDALQFVEFCTAFSEVLCIKEGQHEHILQELTRECVGRLEANSSIVQFHVKLLSLIKKDMGKGSSSWVEALEKCINGSQCIMDGFPMDFPIKDSFWYCDLEPSKKLKLLNFLCDEILGTKEVRNWIDKEDAKYDEEIKKNREKLFEARRKEKHLKQKLKDERAKSVLSMREGAPLSLSEHNDLISKIRAEADEAHSEMLGTINLLPKNKKRSHVVRTEPILLEGNGHVYWKLRSYNNNSNIILQDIGRWDMVTLKDKWLTFDEEQEKVVEKHVSSLRNCRPTIHNRPSAENTSADNEGKEHYDADNSENQNCSTEELCGQRKSPGPEERWGEDHTASGDVTPALFVPQPDHVVYTEDSILDGNSDATARGRSSPATPLGSPWIG